MSFHFIEDDLGFDGYAWIMVWKLLRVSEARWLMGGKYPSE